MEESKRNNPCPVCELNKDINCRCDDDVIFCNNVFNFEPIDNLKIGETLIFEGIVWALDKTNSGNTYDCHVFKLHRLLDIKV